MPDYINMSSAMPLNCPKSMKTMIDKQKITRVLMLCVALLWCALGSVYGDEVYYLQSKTSPGTLTGDFYTTALCSQSVAVSYDDVDYTYAVRFTGNITAITSNNYPDRMIRYDCKTTETEFMIVAYANANSKTLYVGDIKESTFGSANTVTAYTAKTLDNGSITTQTYSISSTTPASLFVSVNGYSNAFIVQIIATEKGDPLPKPGDTGYKTNFNKHRLVARSNASTYLDNPNFEINPYGNHTAGNEAQLTIQNKGTNYVKFTNPSACKLKVAVSSIGSSKGFYLADDKSATVNPSALQNDGAKTYEFEIAAGTHFIVPNGGAVRITSMEFEAIPTYSVTYEKNGHGDETVTDLTDRICLPDPLPDLTESGWDFYGWYLESTFITPAVAGAKLTEDVTLYAKWVEHKETAVTLSADGAENAYTTSVTAVLGVSMPAITTLPVQTGFEFAGYYDGIGGTGKMYYHSDGSSACDWDKDMPTTTLYAKWVYPPFQYILASLNVKNNVLTRGGNGSVSAWLYNPEEETLTATNDISFEAGVESFYFESMNLTEIGDESKWTPSSSSNRTAKSLGVTGGKTVQFSLNDVPATRITFFVFPASNDPYSVDLTVNGITENKPIPSGQQNKVQTYVYEDGPFTGTFSIKSNGKGSKFVVVVDVPQVRVIFDANGGTGTMEQQAAAVGSIVQLYENEFHRTDYKFIGWTEDAGGTGELIYDGSDYTVTADVTLYAKWEKRIFTNITLDATGAFNKYTKSVRAELGEPMPEIGILPEKSGVVFEGYYSEPEGAGIKYYTGLGGTVRAWDQNVSTATLYAHWVDPCALTPTLMSTIPIITIWDNQDVDLGVVRLSCDFDTTGISYSLQSVSEGIPGCSFDYFDEQIHLAGKPALGNSEVVTKTITFTMTNDCSSSPSYTVDATIRIYPAGTKPKVAFIVTGTRGGEFDAYNAADRTACSELLDYLDDFYDITCVNGYATKDEAVIEAYYKQYDLLVVTDFLNTKEGYTDALGTMIDKKPMLSFEAYVANLSNWHIGSNPRDPSPKVQDMKILCAGHTVFGNEVVNLADTSVHVLNALSDEKDAKGLQGFVINEAPDFVFLATIRDAANNRDLIVCCERQVVFPARLMLYGINFYEMGNLSPNGKIIMRQMIDYLLMTDETKVADCSLVFDNGAGNSSYDADLYHAAGGTGEKGDGKWSTAANWFPGYNIIPTPYHGARIIAECHVDKDDAHAGSVKINREGHDHVAVDGKLIIEPYGGLTLAGIVTKVNDTRYASPLVIKAEDLLIKADESNNGALVYGNKESDVRATVQYYSRGDQAKTASPVWQYMGIPFQAGQTAIDLYRDAWMCRWAEGTTDGLGGLWQWVENEDVLLPFEGYCITQETTKTYEFKGKLNSPVTTVIELDNYDKDGFAFAANSWTAPIKIQEMQDADFVNADKAVYIYHSGTYADWEDRGTPEQDATSTAATLPGQYAVIPIHSSPYLSGADSVIPAMQGFFVKKTNKDEEAKVRLVYNRVVYDATYFKTSTQPMRAPRRRGPAPQTMRLFVSGEASGGDHVYLLERSDFSENYEDGWDGRKIEGDPSAPMMAVVKESGEMSVAVVPEFEERLLSFRAGKDTQYTFHFDYDGETIYLYDMLTGQATEIRTGNTYSFTATNKTPVERFLITANPPSAPTDIPAVEMESPVVRPQKYLDGDQIYILHGGTVYDIIGRRVMPVTGKEDSR